MQHRLLGLLMGVLIWAASSPDAMATVMKIDSVILPDTTAQQQQKEQQNRPSEDTTVPEIFKDSVRLAIEAKTRQAWRRSMFIPGWGQITNGGLWWVKVPVIYGGFVSTGLIFEFNQRHYRAVLKDVQYRVSNNHAFPPDSPYDYIGADPQGTEYLISWKDYHRRMRDIAVLATVGWYALNIIESYVDSMLKNRWEVSDDLSFQVRPTLLTPTPFAYNAPVFGFNIKLNLH